MREVLLYNPKENFDYDKFKQVAKDNDVSIIEVGKDDIDQKVGFLIGYDGYEETSSDLDFDPSLDFTFMLFKGFSDEELFDFLDIMRQTGTNVPRKAGETENNITWTLRKLLTENAREGQMMGLINKINGLLDKASNLKEKYGEDATLKVLIGEMQEYFKDSSVFELEVAQKYYLRLLDEILRVENEHKEELL